MKNSRIFIDMDGPTVDFDAYAAKCKLPGDIVKTCEGAYLNMAPVPGALEAIRELIRLGFDVFFATKPPSDNFPAYTEKARWVHKYIPEMDHKLIITCDKGLLGNSLDFLIDDRPHKANCEFFPGTFIKFTHQDQWNNILEYFKIVADAYSKIKVLDIPNY